MANEERQNDNSQQSESVEFIPLATLLENPDPDFDVVIPRRNASFARRAVQALSEIRSALTNTENKAS